jgi:alkylation response protein AidB-like acyl-CoA dehydrogenase
MLLSNESQEILALVKDFVDHEVIPNASTYEKNNEFPVEILDMALQMDLGILCMPEELGGPRVDNKTLFAIAEELGRGDIGIATTLIANCLASFPVLLAGTPEQKKHWFDVLQEKKYGAFCLTEPNAGSDASNMKTTAVKDGDDYIINGTKCFITNGGIAGIYTVLAKAAKGRLTAFIVERDREGVSIGKEEDKMGMRLSNTTEVIFDNVRIPKENLLGREGQGFRIIMETLDHSRPGIGALGVGLARRALEEAVKYSKERVQFGHPISSFQAIQMILADMAIETESARQMYLHAADLMDRGLPFTMEAAIAKTKGSDVAVKCALDGLQVLGGYGYMKEYPLEKLVRDSKILQIYEGTNQIQRTVIANQLQRKYK